MAVTLAAVCALVLLVVLWIKRLKDRQEMQQYSITPEVLHTLLTSNQDMLLFDVRLPLDLLADAEIIWVRVADDPGFISSQLVEMGSP